MIYAKCTCGNVTAFQDDEERRDTYRCSLCGMTCNTQEAIQREREVEGELENVGHMIEQAND